MAQRAEIRDVGMRVTEKGLRAPAVVLEAGDEVLPIIVSADQADAIERAKCDTPAERPLAHDLLLEMVRDFGGTIEGLRIDALARGTFFAKVDVGLPRAGGHRQLVFDARPSDGLALAARVGCPITVADEVLAVAGCPPDEFDLAADSSVTYDDADVR